MIIKIIPETDAEKRKIKSVEHKGVREFFIFGNKKDDEGDLVDFHDWSGGYRYLVGSVSYFRDVIIEEMNAKKREEDKNKNEISITPPRPEPKRENKGSQTIPFVKRSGPGDGEITQVVMAEDMGKVIQMPPLPPPPPQSTPMIIDVERDGDKGAAPADDDNDEAGVDK